MSFVKTSTGELVAIADTTGESISVAMASQIAANRAEQSARFAVKTKELNDKINEKLKPNKKDVEAFHKEIEPFLSCEKIIDVERLKSRKGIKQIEDFRTYTDNFKNLDKLKPEEILYLNLCDWLAPQALEINDKLKKAGGLKFINPTTKVEVVIKELDLFHSLLGEMKPQYLNNVTKGGHLPILELKSALFEIGEIESLGSGFFDMHIKRGSNSKINSFFPVGKSVEQCVKMIENAIENVEFIEYIKPKYETTQKAFYAKSKTNQNFLLRIENEIAKFYPYHKKP